MIILYSLASDAVNVMDVDDFATALRAQIQISVALKGMVRKLSIEPIVGQIMEDNLGKDKMTIQVTTQDR